MVKLKIKSLYSHSMFILSVDDLYTAETESESEGEENTPSEATS